MTDTSDTFQGAGDRVTYLLANAQIVVLAVAFTVGSALFIYRPEIPSVPPVWVGVFSSLLLFGPPLFAFFVVGVRKLRQRRMVEVHHVNARTDALEKWYVEPGIWRDKQIDGPNPYPVRGGSAWAVQSFEWDADMDQLRVRGVWLEEVEDTKLLTSKSHFESIYEKLTESHITLNIMRNSISELGADLQERIVNEAAEARERGTIIDEDAVKDVFEEFSDEHGGTGDDDLPTLETEELAQTMVEGDSAESEETSNE